MANVRKPRLPEPTRIGEPATREVFHRLIQSLGTFFSELSETVNNKKEIKASFNFHDSSNDGDTYNLDPDINYHTVSAQASSDTDVIVPVASSHTGKTFSVIRNNPTGGNVLVQTTGGNPIAQGLKFRLDSDEAIVTFISDGNNWYNTVKLGTVTGV